MLSRVADSVYWMGRYIERAENIARFIDVNLNLSLDLTPGAEAQWHPLIDTTGDREAYLERFDHFSRDNVLYFLTFDREYSNSILACLTAARENARSIRPSISTEMWEHLNRFYLMIRGAAEGDPLPGDLHEFYDRIRLAGQQFVGITDATMTHGEGWDFCRLGRMLERADKTSRILDVKYFLLLPDVSDIGTPFDDIQWSALLRSASALEMYRQRHGRIAPRNIVEFLLLDKQFPRAVLHCLNTANDSLLAISGTPQGTFTNVAEQKLGQLRSELAYTRSQEIIAAGLHEFIDDLQRRINTVGDAIHESFFAARPMATAR